MRRPDYFSINCFTFTIAALLLGCGMAGPSPQQEGRVDPASQSEMKYLNRGLVEDWTYHHVVFSNPGTLEDAIKNGRGERWERIVSDPRYRMQWVKRYAASEGLTADDTAVLQAPSKVELPVGVFDKKWKEKEGFSRTTLHADWSETLSGANHGVSVDRYPAKYTFAPIGTPDCTNDFVVFAIDANGSSSQGDLVGVNNLYKTTCTTGTVPNVLFSYDVGTGDVQTSPVLSLDGTKVAFVESITGNGSSVGSNFHVLTLDKRGNSGCPSASPCNGAAYNTPVAPGGTLNNAVDTKIRLSGFVTVTRSSPFVDYTNDVAYVGDDNGKLHKFTGVFTGTPAEVTTAPWPFTVVSGVVLGGPIFDSGASQSIFVGGSDGNLYCVKSTGVACSPASISVASGAVPGPVVDSPIVDSSAETVFAAASNLTNSILMQATTVLGSPVRATMGVGGTDLYNGAFDNAYLTSIGTGHMYFCGNLATAGTPVLYRVTFNSSGTMSSANDGNSFQLVNSGNAGTAVDCTPLTEVFNSSQNTDYLFLGVTDHGFSTGTPNCANGTCIMSFALPTSSPFTFPTGAHATGTNATLNLGTHGESGIIVDNDSGLAGASQLYFANRQQSTGVQVSQSALQ